VRRAIKSEGVLIEYTSMPGAEAIKGKENVWVSKREFLATLECTLLIHFMC